MAKKKSVAKDIILGGATLSLGATAVGALPHSAAQTHVLSGMGTAGSFFPTMATVGIAGGLVNQVKQLNPKRRKK